MSHQAPNWQGLTFHTNEWVSALTVFQRGSQLRPSSRQVWISKILITWPSCDAMVFTFRFLMKALAFFDSPLILKETIPPKPLACFLANSCCGWEGKPERERRGRGRGESTKDSINHSSLNHSFTHSFILKISNFNNYYWRLKQKFLCSSLSHFPSPLPSFSPPPSHLPSHLPPSPPHSPSPPPPPSLLLPGYIAFSTSGDPSRYFATASAFSACALMRTWRVRRPRLAR